MTLNLLVMENFAGLYIELTEEHNSSVRLKLGQVLFAGLKSSMHIKFEYTCGNMLQRLLMNLMPVAKDCWLKVLIPFRMRSVIKVPWSGLSMKVKDFGTFLEHWPDGVILLINWVL